MVEEPHEADFGRALRIGVLVAGACEGSAAGGLLALRLTATGAVVIALSGFSK